MVVAQTMHEKMQQRRIQMVFHSIAYYEYDVTFITDTQFDLWARELAQLQTDHPEVCREVRYAQEFEDWDGTTGYHLTNIEPERFRSKIYHNIDFLLANHPERVTVEMDEFMEQIRRGMI